MLTRGNFQELCTYPAIRKYIFNRICLNYKRNHEINTSNLNINIVTGRIHSFALHTAWIRLLTMTCHRRNFTREQVANTLVQFSRCHWYRDKHTAIIHGLKYTESETVWLTLILHWDKIKSKSSLEIGGWSFCRGPGGSLRVVTLGKRAVYSC